MAHQFRMAKALRDAPWPGDPVTPIGDPRDGSADLAERLPGYDLSGWPDESPPPRKWVYRGLVPAGAATVLNGDGGMGKSRIAYQAMIGAATGLPFLERQPELGGAAVLLSAEMSGLDSVRMLDEVARGMCLTDEQKRNVAERLTIIDLTERGSPLLYGVSGWTHLGLRVHATLRAIRPVLTVVDSASSTYSAPGFEMAPIYDFMAGFTRAIGEDGGLLMLLHEGKSGLRDGNRTHAYMGSVAWHAAARSRLQLTRDKDDRDRVCLEPHKASYSAVGEKIDLVYSNGAFLPPQRDMFVEGLRSASDAKEAVRIIDRLVQLGHAVSPNMQANNNPAAMARRLGLLGALTKERLWAGVGKAMMNGWLRVEEVTRNRNVSTRYGVTEAGRAALDP